jgi:hypothetical protein
MKDNLLVAIGFFALVLLAYALAEDDNEPHVIVYDCRLAEISPDYPIEVKEACRKASAEKKFEN